MSISKLPLDVIGVATKVAVGLLVAGLVVEKAAPLNDMHPDPFVHVSLLTISMALPPFWISLLAPICYLCALWSASNVFMRLHKGEGFGASVVKGLKDVGSNLIYGAVAAIVIMPTLTVMFEDRFRGIRYDFAIEPLTIGLIGLMLWLITQAGAKLQTEMESYV
ncbi:hypothetical protein [Asticcacaulis sp. YBE204]|uniref:hypothetical protein n=1 Tax=Asticcacaulis sp. YBE204 TaxID=1282363 RepID=UPI0003C3D47A|nr:hypothetical protein [Asticcacaulis sp. YBE204]ESQ81333.1 hypothetical protein AEYBE204_03045 [Asticcacaulis sp. YBE204]